MTSEQTLAVSVVVPAYNEEDNVLPLYEKILSACKSLNKPFEILFVDDGSTDKTLEEFSKLAAKDPCVRVLAPDTNGGQSAAMGAGFQAARGEITITLDSDLQNDPADIPLLLEEMDKGFDVVVGWRRDRNDNIIRKISSLVGNGFRNRITRESIHDTGCSLKAYKTIFVKRLKMYRGMHRFLPTLLRLEGATVSEVVVSHHPRNAGVAKYGVWNRLFVGFFDCFAIRWMQSRVSTSIYKEVKITDAE